MSIKTHIAGVYHATASLRVQSWWMRRYGRRVARLKSRIHHQTSQKRRERLEMRYKKNAAKLSEAISSYKHHLDQASHHLASLRTEY
ncbi:hypothetical protein HY497_01875 [Candidatus Woesearchaeota archaeon]|nr:hypothetical protein [Candidatus Woesearchaeota archaeon]